MAIEIIYCAAGNSRFAQIAIEAGMTYGAQLPATVYYPPQFVDQDWKRPDRAAYVAAVAQHRPRMATVLDWERDEQLPEVLAWAEDVAPFVERVILIPKVIGGVPRLPRRIGGRDVVLGYSVPTRYAGTSVPPWEFAGWPVHLLGGSPHRQIAMAHYLNVVSADGNYIAKMAQRWNQFWSLAPALYAKDRRWPRLIEVDGRAWGDGSSTADAPYEAFRRSCVNVMEAWRALEAQAA
jgi:hypothetical protein